MKMPVITRAEYDAKIAELEARLVDLERHFVTKRSESGEVVETLADVPVHKRSKEKQLSTRGMSWAQRKAILEATDGGRKPL
jgi:hypothetical protein